MLLRCGIRHVQSTALASLDTADDNRRRLSSRNDHESMAGTFGQEILKHEPIGEAISTGLHE
jgi:hypothetical protein